jgi:hypothetical protein
MTNGIGDPLDQSGFNSAKKMKYELLHNKYKANRNPKKIPFENSLVSQNLIKVEIYVPHC